MSHRITEPELCRAFAEDLPGATVALCRALMLREGEIPLGLLVVVTDGRVEVITVPISPSYSHRLLTAEMLRKLLQELDATAYAFAHETWMRRATKAEDLDNIGPIRDHPDRIEGVTICGQTPDGTFLRVLETKRSESGAVSDLILREDDNRLQVTGLWTDLLYRKQAS